MPSPIWKATPEYSRNLPPGGKPSQLHLPLYSNLKDFHSPIKDSTRAVGCCTTNLLPQANPQICPAALRQRGQKLAPAFSLPATKGAKASPLVSKGILKAPNRFPKKELLCYWPVPSATIRAAPKPSVQVPLG